MALENSTTFKKRINLNVIDHSVWTVGTIGLKVYKGTQPTGPQFNWSTVETAESANLLISFDNGWSFDDDGSGNLIFSISDGPTSKNAAATGTATWCAITTTNQPNGAIIGPVTLSSGTGMVFLNSLTITSGNPYSIVGFRMTMF